MTLPPRLARTVLGRLRKAYGPRPWRTWGRPLDVLIGTILSQNTSDRNSGLAYERLRRTLPRWDAAADAPLWQIAAAIRPAGLQRQKAASIRAVLRLLRAERGRVTLAHLGRMSTGDARRTLLALPGVGPKTAACVLLFSLKRPMLPVDTHVHRIALRLGLIARGTSAEKAHILLAGLVPPPDVYAFHVLLIHHGRVICHARRPEHERCVLRDVCPTGRGV
jgi:endonuclease-3